MKVFDFGRDAVQKHIHGGVAVWDGFAKELGDNGLMGDARCACRVAPSVGEIDLYVYMRTNGYDQVVGWFADGEFVLGAEARTWIGSDDMAWLRDVLREEFDYHVKRMYKLRRARRLQFGVTTGLFPFGTLVEVSRRDEATRKVLLRIDDKYAAWFHESIMNDLTPALALEPR